MKKTIAITLWIVLSTSSLYAYTEHNIQSANFLATQWVINDNSNNIIWYNLDDNITRREVLKVMMNISGNDVPETCNWDFSDLDGNDWGCKYAEAALREWYIAANATFRPNDNVTQIEALKMIMQANGIERNANDDWRAGYVSKGFSQWLLIDDYLEYDTSAMRGWIFSTWARSYNEFSYEEPEIELTPEEEELFKFLLEL